MSSLAVGIFHAVRIGEVGALPGSFQIHFFFNLNLIWWGLRVPWHVSSDLRGTYGS